MKKILLFSLLLVVRVCQACPIVYPNKPELMKGLGPVMMYQSPTSYQFLMESRNGPTDCGKMNELLQKLRQLDCSRAKDLPLCDSYKNSIQFESKWGSEMVGGSRTFVKNYALHTSAQVGNSSKYSMRFDVLYASSAEVSMPEAMQLITKGVSNSFLLSLMSELNLDSSISLVRVDQVPAVKVRNKILACGLEKGDLLLEANSKLYISFSHPLDSIKDKVLTQVYRKALELNDSSKKQGKKSFDLGVEVGKSLATIKDLNLSASELDEVATSIHSLLLKEAEDGFFLQRSERDVSKVVHEWVSPGYQMQESVVQFLVK